MDHEHSPCDIRVPQEKSREIRRPKPTSETTQFGGIRYRYAWGERVFPDQCDIGRWDVCFGEICGRVGHARQNTIEQRRKRRLPCVAGRNAANCNPGARNHNGSGAGTRPNRREALAATPQPERGQTDKRQKAVLALRQRQHGQGGSRQHQRARPHPGA